MVVIVAMSTPDICGLQNPAWGKPGATKAEWVEVWSGWGANKGCHQAGLGVAAVQLYAFREQTCAQQLGEQASR